MNKRSSKRKKKEQDFAANAFRVFQEAIGEKPEAEVVEKPSEPTTEERHAAAVALGRLGWKEGRQGVAYGDSLRLSNAKRLRRRRLRPDGNKPVDQDGIRPVLAK